MFTIFLLQICHHSAVLNLNKKNQTEKKAKVVAAVWGMYLLAALAI